MSSFTTLKIEPGESAFVILLNRPESRNAISVAMMKDLVAALAEAEQRRTASAVIITGGDSFFSSGRDLKEVLANSDNASIEASRTAWLAVTESIERSPKPVIAAIEGNCLTGGLELALACDLRVAGEGAKFAITSARLGTLPAFGATQRLPRLIGVPAAMEMLFLAESIDADEAYRIGLVNRKTRRGGALDECRRIAETIAERAPLSLATMKKAVYGGLSMPLAEAIEWELALGGRLSGSRDRKEGIAAFTEKRKPRFIGE